MIIIMSLSTFVTLFLVFCAIFGIGYIFTKISKKEEREFWVQEHPNDSLPKRLQYIEGDPNDDKPKFRYLAKIIISFSFFLSITFVLLFILSVLKNMK